MHTTTRNHTFDALRTLVILLMIGSHTTRMISNDAWIFWNKFVLFIEPFTASSFLFLVGSSLVLSFKKCEGQTGENPHRWLTKKMMRCLFLWFVSFFMYFVSIGFVLPDSIVLSGILATIAYSTLVFGLLIIIPYSSFVIISFTVASTVLYLLLDIFTVRLFFLTDGNSPLLPLTIFTGLGVLFTKWLPSLQIKGKKVLIIICVFSFILPVIVWGLKEVFSYPLGRYDIKRKVKILSSIERPIPEKSTTCIKTRYYYNLRPVLLPVITAMIVLCYFIMTWLSQIIHGRILLQNILKRILALGRNSLDIYIIHLLLLAVFFREKSSITNMWQSTLVLVALIVICYAYVIAKEKIRLNKR